MKPETFTNCSFSPGLGSMAEKSERRSGAVRRGTLKSLGRVSLGILGETAVGLLFWAKEHCAPIKSTHRSNPRKSALERLQYLSRFVTSREKPYLDGSMTRIIQESRMMRVSRMRRGHTKVLFGAPLRMSFVKTKYFRPNRRSWNDKQIGKTPETQAIEPSHKLGQVNSCVLYIYSI